MSNLFFYIIPFGRKGQRCCVLTVIQLFACLLTFRQSPPFCRKDILVAKEDRMKRNKANVG